MKSAHKQDDFDGTALQTWRQALLGGHKSQFSVFFGVHLGPPRDTTKMTWPALLDRKTRARATLKENLAISHHTEQSRFTSAPVLIFSALHPATSATRRWNGAHQSRPESARRGTLRACKDV